MNFLQAFEESKSGFAGIAQKLFDNYAIEARAKIFRIMDIEFYWHSKNHPDKSTYGRKHVDPKTGEWFFHYSGVDIALRNERTGGFGGILIRGLYDLNEERRISGPQVCAMKLFSGYDAFAGSITTRIIGYEFPPAKIQSHERVGLGMNAKDNGADRLKYRFSHKVPPLCP